MSQINDINLQWKTTVASLANLPTVGNLSGDVRVTRDTGNAYEWSGSAWRLIAGPGAVFGPAGSDQQVQFNQGGVFGASGDLNFNYSAGQLYVGNTTAFSTERERVSGTQTNPSVPATDAACSITYGVYPGYPTGGYPHTYRVYTYTTVAGIRYYSATYSESNQVTDNNTPVTSGPPTSGLVAINYSGTGYIADGSTRSYVIYSYDTNVAGATVYSSGNTGGSDTDDNSSNPYSVDISWNGTAAGYIIVRTEDDSWVDVGAVTSFIDDNTLFGIDFGFVNTPTEVPDYYRVDVSWTNPGGITGFLLLAQDGYTPKNYDYYVDTAATPNFTDIDVDWITPVIDISNTIAYDTALHTDGNVNVLGHIIMEDQPATSGNVYVIGSGATVSGANNVAMGPAITVTGDTNVVIGSATSSNNSNVVIGASSSAAASSVVIGNGSSAATGGNTGDIAIGFQVACPGQVASAMGYQSTASGDFSLALGYTCTASSSQAVAVGSLMTASGQESAAMGVSSSATATGAVAIGSQCSSSAAHAVAIGKGAVSATTKVMSLATLNAAGDVTTVNLQGYTTSTGSSVKDIFGIVTAWPTSSNATRKGRAIFNIYDTAAREAMRMEASGTASMLGFFGAAAIAQPTNAVAAAAFVANTSGIANDTATFDGYTIGQVVKALRNLGVLA